MSTSPDRANPPLPSRWPWRCLRDFSGAAADDPNSRFIREDRAGHLPRLLARMTPADIALARERAARRR